MKVALETLGFCIYHPLNLINQIIPCEYAVYVGKDQYFWLPLNSLFNCNSPLLSFVS